MNCLSQADQQETCENTAPPRAFLANQVDFLKRWPPGRQTKSRPYTQFWLTSARTSFSMVSCIRIRCCTTLLIFGNIRGRRGRRHRQAHSRVVETVGVAGRQPEKPGFAVVETWTAGPTAASQCRCFDFDLARQRVVGDWEWLRDFGFGATAGPACRYGRHAI